MFLRKWILSCREGAELGKVAVWWWGKGRILPFHSQSSSVIAFSVKVDRTRFHRLTVHKRDSIPGFRIEQTSEKGYGCSQVGGGEFD
jgi:hypothetical protein